jgi:hypothetical protein
VRELEGDVAAADKDDTTWQFLQLQELRAGGEQLLARYPQIGMARAGCDHHMATNQNLLAHLDARPIHEVGTAMPRDDPRLRKALLVLLRHQVGHVDEDLLGIAPAQLASSSEGVVIDDGYALGGRAGPQDNYINA